MLPRQQLLDLIRAALNEDIGSGDITTEATLPAEARGTALATAKAALVVAGIDVFGEVFRTLDPALVFRALCKDGEPVEKGAPLAEVEGSLASILTAERVALNLFQRLSGIATLTQQFVAAVAGTRARILDTRKTVPGLRILDKYAVRAGGGRNHRFALYDGVLIKDNHIAAAGGIAVAVKRCRERIPHTLKIEVEVKNLSELEEALTAGADAVLLDNMGLDEMSRAVARVAGRIPLEASGNMSLARVREVAAVGVDLISVGALTHSVAAADISLNVTQVKGT
ncbi:MAG: carboxylating nicotinate-nucleotide diphosphorylase [Deltaproteobacteria bacterium]|nr:carboxylating nicotinate-nucleotide diphosphorylase [Deltaproteobacteria bacterium]